MPTIGTACLGQTQEQSLYFPEVRKTERITGFSPIDYNYSHTLPLVVVFPQIPPTGSLFNFPCLLGMIVNIGEEYVYNNAGSANATSFISAFNVHLQIFQLDK